MEGTTMKHQLSTLALLALIAVPISACGSTTGPVQGQPGTAGHQSDNRVYESDIVSKTRAKKEDRVYESDLVSKARAATQ
jgi:hypothetical protein